MNNKRDVLKIKSFDFALKCVKIYKKLCEVNKEYILSKQFVRSGTSIGANVQEAQNAESKADFIHKFGIAQKECAETIYWLELLKHSNFISSEDHKKLESEANELLKNNTQFNPDSKGK